MKAMGFLYGSTATGRTGADGSVEVSDTEPLVTVAIGVRGDYTNERFAEALARLEAWLAKSGEWKRDGEPRVLAYNSPMVPAREKYAEVEIPVRRAEDAAGGGKGAKKL
jgi:hypothetical protein